MLTVLGICLLSNFSQAQQQALGSLYGPSNQQLNEFRIKKGMSLRQALEKIEKRFGVVFLYRTDAVENHKIFDTIYLANDVEKALGELLKGKQLQFKQLNRKTYGIYPEDKSVPNKKNVLAETVSGRVTDSSTGEALAGVNIKVKATTTGTFTNGEGHYELEVASLQDTLMFSFVGYKRQQVPISGRAEINVEMKSQTITGQEMVVVGYGEVAKEDLTGSVARVKGETFKNQSITQITDMLAGTVAGVNISQGTSAAGGGSLEIRGPTSLTASTSPMVVVDGAVYNGSLRAINPSDIENIDVLKGASAAAIYGSKAASGVIIVTTKKGTTGEQPIINITAKVGGTEPTTDKYGIRGPENYIKFRRAYLRSTRSEPDYYWDAPDNLREGVTIDQWRAANPSPLADNTEEYLSRLNFFPIEKQTYLAGKTINWYDQVMQTGLRQDYNLSIRGGSKKTKYYWSGGYVNNEGIIRGDQFSTLRTRLNLSYEVVNWLEVGTNTQFSVRDESAVPADLYRMQKSSPYAKMRNDDGTLKWYPSDYPIAQNPLINTLGQDKDRKINDLFSSLYAKVIFPFGFTYKASFQPHIVSSRDYDYWSPQTLRGGRDNSGGLSQRTDYSQYRWMVENLVKWNKTFGVHNFDVTLMQNAEKSEEWNSFMQNNTFRPSPTLGYSGMQFGTNPSINSNDTEYTADALLGRLNYTLLDKYLLTASVRRDGYSAFGQKHPHAIFPAVALAWKISNEDFFDIDWINQLKLRLSWGRNGNRDIGRYAALAQLSSNMYYNGSGVQIGVTTSKLANPDLQWEETESINIGLDIGMFEDRVNLSLNYYNMTTHNLLVNRSLPSVTGFNSITTNIGGLDNKGFEMSLNSVNFNAANVSWSSNLVFSFNRNKISELFGKSGEYTLLGETKTGEIPDIGNRWFPGRSIDVIWDYDIIGIWQQGQSDEAARYNLKPGDIKAVDVDGNGIYQELEDKQFIGHTKPRYRIGLRNNVDFLENFTASVFIRADVGQMRPFPVLFNNTNTYDRRNTPPVPYWTKENKSNDWPRLGHNFSPYGGGIMMYKPATFVRIQDLSLSYTLPADIGKRFNIKQVRIFGSTRNAVTFTNWPGWDPESGFNEPMPRTYTMGINISL